MTDTITAQEETLLRLFRRSDDDGKADILGIAFVEAQHSGRRITQPDDRSTCPEY